MLLFFLWVLGEPSPAQTQAMLWYQDYLAAEKRALAELSERADDAGDIRTTDPRFTYRLGGLIRVFGLLAMGDEGARDHFQRMGLSAEDRDRIEKVWWNTGKPAYLTSGLDAYFGKDARYMAIWNRHVAGEQIHPKDALYIGRYNDHLTWRLLAEHLAETYLALTPEGRSIVDRIADLSCELDGVIFTTDAGTIASVAKDYGFTLAP
ncbi:hypothetical protein [Acanthopleuribacter pedis]|uniref:Uncharacterized protein n=1 Tax=Acanthopleuribacter pedis TaxID=442870 RepID=A0A8J7QFQ6_9BACT|nr:hypothetical protein [Acanthopleuribacter pedis]MBO1317738.1 hypothetical protein [Acanthopleuribacter pedis]